MPVRNEERLSSIETDIVNIKEDLNNIDARINDLSDMKLILVELKTISAYQVKRMDTYENSLESLTDTMSSIKESNSIPTSEIFKYILFTTLGVIITTVMGLIIK